MEGTMSLYIILTRSRVAAVSFIMSESQAARFIANLSFCCSQDVYKPTSNHVIKRSTSCLHAFGTLDPIDTSPSASLHITRLVMGYVTQYL